MSSLLCRCFFKVKYDYIFYNTVKRKELYFVNISPNPCIVAKKYFCSKPPSLETAADEGKQKSDKKLESFPEKKQPHITDDDDFTSKFWREYESKKEKESEAQDALHYPDRIRYRKVYKDPIHRAFGIMRDDILQLLGKLKDNPIVNISKMKDGHKPLPQQKIEIFPNYCDGVIIGGGLVGTAIALHIQERALRALRIIVVEKDLSFSRASSVLSVGGIRQQFNTPENIMLSKYGMDFLKLAKQRLTTKEFDPDIGINFNGYLTLATESGFDQLVKNYNEQASHGAHVQLFSKTKLKSIFPWLNTDGIEAGVYGVQREGWIDPWSFLLAMNRKTRELGTQFVNGTVTSCGMKPLGDVIRTETPQTRFQIKKVDVTLPNGETRDINCAFCVIAAGCSSGEVGRIFGIGDRDRGNLSVPIPVEPRKRYVYCVTSPDGPGLNCPLVIDPRKAYFRREGLADMYLCGMSPEPHEEPSVEDLDVDHAFFEDKVWPVVANRCPSFEKLKLHSSWAGFYDYNTFDQNAIIGLHPMFSNLYMATGFSGHGVQQAAGAGLAISELLFDGQYKTMNLERFGFERILFKDPILESCVY